MSIMALLALAEQDLVKASGLGPECWRWEVQGNQASATYEDPQGHLVKLPWVHIINGLHSFGWKRGGQMSRINPVRWNIYAFLRHGDAEVRVEGYATSDERPEGCTHGVSDFFAPNPPPFVRGQAWVKAMREWQKRCSNDEW